MMDTDDRVECSSPKEVHFWRVVRRVVLYLWSRTNSKMCSVSQSDGANCCVSRQFDNTKQRERTLLLCPADRRDPCGCWGN